MKRATEEKIARALDELADGLQEIGEMGLLELRLKYKSVLSDVVQQVRAAAKAVKEDR